MRHFQKISIKWFHELLTFPSELLSPLIQSVPSPRPLVRIRVCIVVTMQLHFNNSSIPRLICFQRQPNLHLRFCNYANSSKMVLQRATKPYLIAPSKREGDHLDVFMDMTMVSAKSSLSIVALNRLRLFSLLLLLVSDRSRCM